jgi:misacylated tRNA(Ala) deacylase
MRIPDLIRTKINLLPPDIQVIRIVEIVGVDVQADGGTHVHQTLEVGGVRVLKTENKGKLNKRMEIAVIDE